jgi:hypothetical protein
MFTVGSTRNYEGRADDTYMCVPQPRVTLAKLRYVSELADHSSRLRQAVHVAVHAWSHTARLDSRSPVSLAHVYFPACPELGKRTRTIHHRSSAIDRFKTARKTCV